MNQSSSSATSFKQWPLAHKFWIAAILMGFWLSGLNFSLTAGKEPYAPTDSTSEMIVIYGARHFVDHGFFEHYLLPTYPPFGNNDSDGKPRTSEFVYNHYLAGSDLILASWMKFFGKEAIGTARMIPHTLTVVAMGVTTLAFGALFQSSLLACLFLSLLMIPRSLVVWSTCLYGHSYATAVFLFLCAGIMGLASQKSNEKKAVSLGFFSGLAVTFFALDWGPLCFLAAMALCALFHKSLSKRVQVFLLGGIALGGIAAGLYQFTITILDYGSISAAFGDMLHTAALRNGLKEHPAHFIDHPLPRVLREFNRQAYGATGFTAFNLMGLSAAFLLMGWAGAILNKKDFFKGLAAVALGYLSAACWGILMKSHSMGNMHYTVRHYFVVYFVFLLIALPIGHQLVLRSRKAST